MAYSFSFRQRSLTSAFRQQYKLMLVPLGSSQQQEKRNFELYKDQLAIKTVSWSPDTQYISVGSYDQVLRLINSRTWKVEAEFRHTKKPPKKNTTVRFTSIKALLALLSCFCSVYTHKKKNRWYIAK